MEFRRINGLPPYVFAAINQLRDEARHAGDDVIDLGFRQPGHPEPADSRREVGRGGPQPPQPPLLVLPGPAQPAPGRVQPVQAPLRGGGGPRDRGRVHHRGQRGPVPPDVGAARPGRHRPGADAVLPDTHLRAPLRRGRRAPGAGRPGRGLLRQPGVGLRGGDDQAEGDRVLVPAQPDDGMRGHGLDAADRRVRPGPRHRARARFRLFGHVFRRVRTSLAAPGARGQGSRCRALHVDQELFHGRLEGRLHRRQRRGGGRAHKAEELPRLRDLPAHPDSFDRRLKRGAGLPEDGKCHLRVPARHARWTASTA